MDENRQKAPRPANPRRKKRSPLQIFKEAYLPAILAGAAVLLIIIFICGSVSRSSQKKKAEEQARYEASVSLENEMNRLAAEAQSLIVQAKACGESYDYDGALQIMNTFTGNMNDFPELISLYQQYQDAKSKLVLWDDPSKVTSLSFQLLIADPVRAFNDATYSSSFKKNFITTEEFSKILQSLYKNGYMLVSMEDFITTETTSNGATVYKAKPLYLPEGKKPLLLTQTNVNYNLYLVDSDGDMLPDKNGCGFASRLVVNPDGSVTCEMVDSTGATVTGDYDLVPILDKFVEAHPDFSYRGAKAVLALTGYNGLFGYRTNAEAQQALGAAAYEQAVNDAKAVAAALRKNGYALACYTYENAAYGERSLAQIQADLTDWTAEVLPILGKIDVLVYALNSDISNQNAYIGEKYNYLYDYGFRHFLGFCEDGTPWTSVADNYVRIGRILVGGANISQHPDWFTGMFDTSILDTARNG